MISSTLYFLLIQLNYKFPYPLFKSDWFTREINWFAREINWFAREIDCLQGRYDQKCILVFM